MTRPPASLFLPLGALCAWFVLSSARAAEAPASAPSGAVAEACRQDVQTLCSGVQPGEGRVVACLRENRAKLSDGCKAALRAERRHHKEPGTAAG